MIFFIWTCGSRPRWAGSDARPTSRGSDVGCVGGSNAKSPSLPAIVPAPRVAAGARHPTRVGRTRRRLRSSGPRSLGPRYRSRPPPMRLERRTRRSRRRPPRSAYGRRIGSRTRHRTRPGRTGVVVWADPGHVLSPHDVPVGADRADDGGMVKRSRNRGSVSRASDPAPSFDVVVAEDEHLALGRAGGSVPCGRYAPIVSRDRAFARWTGGRRKSASTPFRATTSSPSWPPSAAGRVAPRPAILGVSLTR